MGADERVIIELPLLPLLDKAFRDRIDRIEKHDNPEQRIPGDHIELRHIEVKTEIAHKNGAAYIQQHSVQRITLPPFQDELFFEQYSNFFE